MSHCSVGSATREGAKAVLVLALLGSCTARPTNDMTSTSGEASSTSPSATGGPTSSSGGPTSSSSASTTAAPPACRDASSVAQCDPESCDWAPAASGPSCPADTESAGWCLPPSVGGSASPSCWYDPETGWSVWFSEIPFNVPDTWDLCVISSPENCFAADREPAPQCACCCGGIGSTSTGSDGTSSGTDGTTSGTDGTTSGTDGTSTGA